MSTKPFPEQDHAADQGQKFAKTDVGVQKFLHLQKMYWGRLFWARGYFVASCGNVTDEIIRKYIQHQEGVEPSDGGDNFQIAR